MCGSRLSRWASTDAAVEPCGQAGVAQIVRPPRERRDLLGRGERRIAGLGPGAAVGDSGQVATPDPGEQAAVHGGAEAGDVVG